MTNDESKIYIDKIAELEDKIEELRFANEGLRNRPASLRAADNTIVELRKKLGEARGTSSYKRNGPSYDELHQMKKAAEEWLVLSKAELRSAKGVPAIVAAEWAVGIVESILAGKGPKV